MIIGDEFYTGAIPEIDDVHHADALLGDIMNLGPERRVLRIARILAGLREYYVQVGQRMEREGC